MKLLSVVALVAAILGTQAPAALAAEGLPGATVRADGGKSAAERRVRMEANHRDTEGAEKRVVDLEAHGHALQDAPR